VTPRLPSCWRRRFVVGAFFRRRADLVSSGVWLESLRSSFVGGWCPPRRVWLLNVFSVRTTWRAAVAGPVHPSLSRVAVTAASTVLVSEDRAAMRLHGARSVLRRVVAEAFRGAEASVHEPGLGGSGVRSPSLSLILQCACCAPLASAVLQLALTLACGRRPWCVTC
jgi:hypothetical protein